MKNKNWKDILSPLQYQVMREKATEPPFSGKYDKHFEPGRYYCSACGQELFDSATKFDANSGWPSFDDVISPENVILKKDLSQGMSRTEVMCSNCQSHLGHVFDDGPQPTGKRYCINSVALNFKKKKT